jgi:protein-S-isoprenylcysteine O-methyltransferase Ste14
MIRYLTLLYGVVCYVIFFITFLYAIGFMGNLVVPKSIDAVPTAPLLTALIVNTLLLGLFAVQHSVMARPAFKKWWTGLTSPHNERSTYVLLSSIALIILFRYWQPMGGVIWSLESGPAVTLMWAGFAFGWGLVLVSTFLINHFDLFGLRHVWLYFRGEPYTNLRFSTPGPYKLVRHPLYVGWIFAFWCTPIMTIAHLFFAVVTTIYILLAIQWEEKDLIDVHGEDYKNYKRRVPMLIPFTKKQGGTEKPM